MNPENFIADHVKSLPRSGIRDFFAIVSEMPQAISLGIGEPDFVTPWKIREASIFALEKGKTSYTDNRGLLSLRKEISMVTQDTTLFDDTIRNNIAYGKPDATDKEINEAAKNSFASDFIEKLPQKYDTQIGEDGVRLSGGEKQRISIARALLKKSPIILLDEATSSLDSETEEKIQKAINILTKNKTTLVIAHRLSTIHNANKIFVLKEGKIVNSGKHDFLINNCLEYKSLYKKQLQ